ncbi:hypothetical protein [Thalassobacillus pellis]|uniref:hypothetical protein n=1 Tax=Thalassobacillus pellis TaxID=748008 RepID=UPI001960466A|nr:hypothetical protein [Thalassobacillus pellis]MBM7551632.1 hypothetical protein [Thalassobacillus pellis]
MKKIGLLLVALLMLCSIPVSSVAAAGNGGWDYQGWRDFYYNYTYDWWDTTNVQSTGGSVLIQANSAIGYVEMWEHDPGSSNDDFVGSVNLSEWESKYWNINSYVDGSNNRAEVYVRTYQNPGNYAAIYFWD